MLRWRAFRCKAHCSSKAVCQIDNVLVARRDRFFDSGIANIDHLGNWFYCPASYTCRLCRTLGFDTNQYISVLGVTILGFDLQALPAIT